MYYLIANCWGIIIIKMVHHTRLYSPTWLSTVRSLCILYYVNNQLILNNMLSTYSLAIFTSPLTTLNAAGACGHIPSSVCPQTLRISHRKSYGHKHNKLTAHYFKSPTFWHHLLCLLKIQIIGFWSTKYISQYSKVINYYEFFSGLLWDFVSPKGYCLFCHFMQIFYFVIVTLCR